MGKINVKLADNYYYGGGPGAADTYNDVNYVKSLKLPKVDYWQVAPNADLIQGFGVTGKVIDGSAPGYCAFHVCFLFNQQEGFWTWFGKTIASLSKEGLITPRQEKLWSSGSNNNWSNKEMIGQLYLDAAKATCDILNKLNNQDDFDWDFTYQFNPSDVASAEKSVFKNIAGAGTGIVKENATLPAGSAGGTLVEYQDPLSGDVFPGYYGSLRTWMEGNSTSFFGAGIQWGYEERQEAEDAITDDLNKCKAEQESKYEEQQTEIAQPAIAAMEAAKKAAAEAAKKSSAPSIPSDAFDLFTNGDVNNLFEMWMKYQTDGKELAAEIQKAVASEIGINGQVGFTEQDGKRYVTVGGSFLNEPQAAGAAKAIKMTIHSQA